MVDQIDTSKVSRIEGIDQRGRVFVRYGFTDVSISLQDDGRTLKIFSKLSGVVRPERSVVTLARDVHNKWFDHNGESPVTATVPLGSKGTIMRDYFNGLYLV